MPKFFLIKTSVQIAAGKRHLGNIVFTINGGLVISFKFPAFEEVQAQIKQVKIKSRKCMKNFYENKKMLPGKEAFDMQLWVIG